MVLSEVVMGCSAEEEGDDGMFPFVRGGARALAASRGWELAFMSKLHPVPTANEKRLHIFQ